MAHEGQHLVRVLVPNRLPHVLQRPHSVDHDDTTGAFQSLASAVDRRDRLTLLRDGHCSQDERRRGSPRTHYVERTAINRPVKSRAYGLAIDGHHLAGKWPPIRSWTSVNHASKPVRTADGANCAHVSWAGIPLG
jgi:hypothetical protein